MRQIITCASGIPGIKCKFQYLHSRIPALPYELSYRVRHVSKIFRNNFFLPKPSIYRAEKFNPRSLFPMPVPGRCLTIRDRIILIKSSEMVNSYDIIKLVAVRQSADPPVISRTSVIIPPIERISPHLSVCCEPIRRTTRNRTRKILPVQLEQFRVRPRIRTVKRNIDRNISDDPDSPVVGIFL